MRVCVQRIGKRIQFQSDRSFNVNCFVGATALLNSLSVCACYQDTMAKLVYYTHMAETIKHCYFAANYYSDFRCQ